MGMERRFCEYPFHHPVGKMSGALVLFFNYIDLLAGLYIFSVTSIHYSTSRAFGSKTSLAKNRNNQVHLISLDNYAA
jgi:hypothetical protein